MRRSSSFKIKINLSVLFWAFKINVTIFPIKLWLGIRLLCICPDISARFGCQSSGQTLDLEMATNLLSNAVDAYSICRPLAPSSIDEYILNSDQISIPKPDKHVLAKFTSMINQDIEKFQKLVQ